MGAHDLQGSRKGDASRLLGKEGKSLHCAFGLEKDIPTFVKADGYYTVTAHGGREEVEFRRRVGNFALHMDLTCTIFFKVNLHTMALSSRYVPRLRTTLCLGPQCMQYCVASGHMGDGDAVRAL
jgi:hypothetical protein